MSIKKNFQAPLVRLQWLMTVSVIFFPSLVLGQADDLSAPRWISDRSLHTDDGYVALNWQRKSGVRTGLFLVTETTEGHERSFYVNGGSLTLLRTAAGEYRFHVRACARGAGNAPQCGKQSKAVTLVVSDAARSTQSSTDDALEQAFAAGSTSDTSAPELRPGLWFNPARNGHGFSFYQANPAVTAETDPLFGSGYDLHALWYTYEAKTLATEPGMDPIPINYQPVAARLRLVQVGPGRYSGGIYITRKGVEVQQGSATVTFESNLSQAMVDWSADFKLERIWGQEPIELLLSTDPGDVRNISHLGGTWAPGGNGNYRVVYDIGSASEAVQILFEDAAGDMTWVQAAQGGQPATVLTNLCFYYVRSGYAPVRQGVIHYAALGCDYGAPGASTNRNARREFTGFENMDLWASFALPYNRGGLSIGSFQFPETFRKTANFHRIGFAPAESPCVAEDGVCTLSLDWFTEGHYPAASAFVHQLDTGHRRLIADSPGANVSVFPVTLEEPGRHVFELRMGNTADSTLMAESGEVLVPEPEPEPEQAPDVPQGLNVSWLDNGAVVYRVAWQYADYQDLARFELEELAPGSTTAQIHLAAPSSSPAIDFDRSGGPFGVHSYRVRACRETGSCSDWTAAVDWQVDEPLQPDPDPDPDPEPDTDPEPDPDPDPDPDLPPANPETPPAPAVPPDFSIDAGSVITGATVGEFSVDAQGAANYRIPLLTAPGSGGLAPELALHYRSQGPNDSLGVGWSIAGLSVITRCPQTREQDGIDRNANVSLDYTDRFCLDGQRLIGVTGPYGSDGAEYRLEVGDPVRILSFGRAGYGPERFEVWHGDGSVSHYGGTPDSVIEARVPGDHLTALSWTLSRQQDSSDNYIEYRYEENTAGAIESTLQVVRYTGNTAAGTEPYAELRFHYQDGRIDVPGAWLKGGMASRDRLLTRVDSLAKARSSDASLQPLRSWFLTYGQDGFGRNIVESIEECSDAARSYCFAPTRFDWIKHESEINAAGPQVGQFFPREFKGMELADVNGDGRRDLLIINGRNLFSLSVAYAQPNGTFAAGSSSYAIPAGADPKQPVTVLSADLDADGKQDLLYPKAANNRIEWTARLSTGTGFGQESALSPGCCGQLDPNVAQLLDFNGDGRVDLLTNTGRDESGAQGRLVLLLNETRPNGPLAFSEPRGLLLEYSSALFPDDPNDDWRLEDAAPGFSTLVARNPNAVQAFDYDGDGDVDLLGRVARRYIRCDTDCLPPTLKDAATADDQTFNFKKTAVKDDDVSLVAFFILFESDGLGAYSQREVIALDAETGCDVPVACSPWHGLARVRQMLQVEINGDGLADLAYRDDSDLWSYRLNTGAGFSEPTSLIGASDAERSEKARFVDIGGDGYPEFVYPSAAGDRDATWIIHENALGAGFAAARPSTIRVGNSAEGDSSILADFNGDGMTDSLFLDFRNGRVRGDTSRLYLGSNSISVVSGHSVNAISAITDGLGKTVRIEYGRLTDPAVHTPLANARGADWGLGSVVLELVAPVSVVRGVAVSAPAWDDRAGFLETEYHYVGAKVQAGGRGFLGFGEVVQWSPDTGLRTNSRYRQDFPFTGLLVDTLLESAPKAAASQSLSALEGTAQPQWPAVDSGTLAYGARLDGATLSYSVNKWHAAETVTGTRARNVQLERRLTISGSPSDEILARTLVENGYDTLGRLVRSVERVFAGEEADAERTVTTTNTYLGAEGDWNISRLASSEVHHQRPGVPEIKRSSAFGYDPQTGLKTLEITEPDDLTFRVETALERDKFGNRTRTTVSAADVPARTSRLLYDELGRFAVAEYNSFDQAVMQVHRWNRFGTPLKVSDIDGVTTESVADPMGFVFGHWTETGAWERTRRGMAAGSFCPVGTAMHSWTESGGKPAAGRCLDALRREIRSVLQGFDGTLVYTDKQYEVSGRPRRVSEPYFKGKTRYWNTTAYDVAGRIVAVDSADGSDLEITHGASHCGPDVAMARQTRNALGQLRTEVHNVLGETVTVYDDACGALTYSYDAIGNLTQLRGVDGSVVETRYDLAGRRIALSDPDKGYWQYAWNALGELRRQLDAKGQAMDYEHDAMGRVVLRRELSGVGSLTDTSFVVEHEERTEWQNSTSPGDRGKAQPIEVVYTTVSSANPIHSKRTRYDDFGRPVEVYSQIGGSQFLEETTYDEYGRIFQAFDASGDSRGLRYRYNAYGYLSQLVEAREGAMGTVYRDIRAMDARGRVSYAVLGNGVEVFASHDPRSGLVHTLEAYDVTGRELQFVEYRYDALGNLTGRSDRSGTNEREEDFFYDALNRLTRVEFTSPSAGATTPTESLSLSYDPAGNIRHKSDVGSFTYGQGAAGPHAVTQAGGTSYSYDANGNQVAGGGRTVQYSVFDKPTLIREGSLSIAFEYGIAHQRITRRDQNDVDGTKTTVYLGNVEYVDNGQETWWKRHQGGIAEVVFYPATGETSVRYVVRDHLGSPHNFTSEAGTASEAVYVSFGAFGQRRSPAWTRPLDITETSALNALSNRGFTGHEHLDAMGLVHMNGRIYDPKLGRFLQADPLVQTPDNGQALNRYTYALNNPLSYTDPSGYFLKRFVKRWGRLIAAMVISAVLPGAQGILATAFDITSVYAQAAITGFIAGAITSGTFKGAVIGALTAVAVAGVVEAFNTAKLGKGLVDPEKMVPTEATKNHLFGNKIESGGLYRLEVGLDGAFIDAERIGLSQLSNGETIFTNGVMNNFSDAVKNATIHLNQTGLLKTSYVLHYNPTQNFLTDLLEASKDIIGAHTGLAHSNLARDLASLIDGLSANGVKGVQLIGHSQGGAITASALRFAQKSGMNLSALSGGGVSLNGAPVNAWLARERLGSRYGVQIVSRHQFGDAVHVLGGMNLTNPLEIPVALLRAPALFSGDPSINPHSMPCGNSAMLVCGQ